MKRIPIIHIAFLGFSFLLNLLPLAVSSQKVVSMATDKEECRIDEKFTRMFARDCCGVTGADGEYSVLLPDGRTVWIFGDSFLGIVKPDGSREKRKPWFVRNSMAVQEADTLRSLYNVIDGWESSLVIPPGAPKGKQFSEDSIWYWPGDAFIENGKLKAFMTAFYQAKPGDWGFQWVSANIATFSLPDLKFEKIDHFDYPNDAEVHWGHAVCDDDEDYTYIYGAGNKKVYVARAPRTDITAPWEFFNGSGWVKDSREARPSLDIPGSEQFSVFKYNGKYVLLVQEGGFMTTNICTYISDKPYTGWRNRKVICHTRLPEGVTSTKNLFAYNTLAHPQFIENGELLISSCINSFVVEEVFQDARKYRPVMQRVPIQRIFEE
ncbi:MAG: DUF5005 domain-containing protein [Bacteroidales bacterium]|nr:DUF5005 domain-containing protein [Bacteroidales bacterium]